MNIINLADLAQVWTVCLSGCRVLAAAAAAAATDFLVESTFSDARSTAQQALG